MRGVPVLGLCLLCAGCGQVADAQAKLVADLRIRDTIADYEQAGRSGSALNRCVKAKLVVAAYSDARDQAETQAWTAREDEDCHAAAAALRASPAARP
jgi:hypothetical protein